MFTVVTPTTSLSLDDHFIKRPPATFFVTVEGGGMAEHGILAGDTLIVDRSRTPGTGSIVIAAIEVKHGNKKLRAGRGPVGKAIVVGAKDRETNRVSAAVVGNTDAGTLQGFVGERAAEGATIYTDDHGGYQGMPFEHESVKHSISEYVNGQAHTNGIESFWATLKRGYHGTYHHMSKKHLGRYRRILRAPQRPQARHY